MTLFESFLAIYLSLPFIWCFCGLTAYFIYCIEIKQFDIKFGKKTITIKDSLWLGIPFLIEIIVLTTSGFTTNFKEDVQKLSSDEIAQIRRAKIKLIVNNKQ